MNETKYLDTRDLPKPIRQALKAVGFNKRDISFEIRDKVSFKQESSKRYNRAFAVIINMNTGKYKIGFGSIGGTNQYHTTIVDDCNTSFRFPPHYVIIKGEHGQSGCYAFLIARPDSSIIFMSSDDDHSDKMYKMLKVFYKTSGKERVQLLSGTRMQDIKEATNEGYLNRGSSNDSIKLTKSGKKYIRRYEQMFPEKIFLK